ncbi:MAG: hypothetical protein ACLFWG_06570, partial [Longimicrobiales bacterium]
MTRLFGKIAAVTLAGIALGCTDASGQRFSDAERIEPGEPCPSGMTEIRPQLCLPPALEPPSILDYRPRSTLVVDETPVRRARFPVVDVHGHARDLASPGTLDEMVEALDSLNIQVY